MLQWLAELHWKSGAAAQMEGVYSPVAAAPGAGVGRGQGAMLGTPEVYFAKHIDNSRVVKASDPVRSREMRHFVLAVGFLFLLGFTYAFQHFRSIEYGYKIEAQKKQREELIEANRAFRLEEASLRDPERIDVLARRMGLASPRVGQVQLLETAGDVSAPVMARMTGVAVVVSQ